MITPTPAPSPDPTLPPAARDLVLQSTVLPDAAICGEVALFLRRSRGATLDLDAGMISLAPAHWVATDTYMNLFNLGTWSRGARLHGLRLRLAGEGRVAVQLRRARGPQAVDLLHEAPLELTAAGVELDVAALLGPQAEGPMPPMAGLLSVRITALGPARVEALDWVTRAVDPRPVRLAIAVTTFRREAEVAATAARVSAFLVRDGLSGTPAALFLVDNGGTVADPGLPHVEVLANPNLGGAGGFARGLAEAVDRDYTHVLFMDDDATFRMEALARTAAFLRLARSEAAAVSGAMISSARTWAMWENGAVFHGLCRPQFVGTDLREAEEVAEMELAAARPKPPGFYGGWWFFAFPVAQVRAWPFPFFVRGDDISFSLANRFDTVTLNGVVSFQEDFSAKESPLTLYLDLRNHLHQHLVHPEKEIGAWGTTKIALRFLVRSIVRMHYDSAEAQLAAWDDVMKGPGFFEANADMSRRRPEIAALARTEAWTEAPLTSAVPDPEEPSLRYGRLLKWTLNGHLVPGWRLFTRGIDIPAPYRGLIWPFWGHSRARFYDTTGTRSYEVVHSKRRAAAILWGIATRAVAWRRAYPALRDAHREGYARLAARAFWESRFLRAPAPGTDQESTPQAAE